jgi:peptidoglycan-N-acetylglucosamine deacetylase
MTAGVDARTIPDHDREKLGFALAIVFVALYFLLRLPTWLERIGELKRELQARARSRLLTPVAKLASRLPFPRNVLWRVKTEQKAIALTIDDGPHALVTPAVLEVLKRHRAKATFFVIGENAVAEGNEGLVERIHDEGHELANHTYKDEQSSKLSRKAFARSLRDTHKVVSKVGDVTLFRPAGGRLGRFCWVSRAAKKQHSYTTVLASVYPQDLRISSPDVVVDHLVRQAHDGAIIVVHDGRPERLRVAGILDAALPRLKDRGFRVLTVSELRSLGT